MDMLVKELSGASSIEALAQQLDTEVGTATDINFSMVNIPGIGLAPEVIGAMTTLNEGVVSKGIPAGTSAAVIKVSGTTPNESISERKVRLLLESGSQSYFAQRVTAALASIIDIDDSRVIYY